jgi:orotate phosphoribosyltransferase-like protein
LAIKGKSENLHVDDSSYNRFLEEFKTRFNSIPELRSCELLVSIETTARVNSDIMERMAIPYVTNGLTKIDKNFRMRLIPKGERENVSDIFNLNFDISNNSNICILDDFITTGSSFKNAFIKLPETINKVGVCLFKLDS